MKNVNKVTSMLLLSLFLSVSVFAGDTPISGFVDTQAQTYLDYLVSGFSDYAAYLAHLAGL